MDIIRKVANVLVGKPSAACAKVGHRRGLSNLSLTLAKPTRLVYLEDYYPLSDKRQQDLFEQLFTDIESMYSITRARISLSDLWSERKPAGTSHTSLSCYMHNVCCV